VNKILSYARVAGASRVRQRNAFERRGPASLLVVLDRTFVLRADLVAVPPLPVVVSVIVDLLDRHRRLRRDVVRQIVGAVSRSAFGIVAVAVVVRTSAVVRKFFGIPSDRSQRLRSL
jgi:hypothetical protein